ncbi:helix-turn-helix transcriptional regulator [Cytobacillus horneckiae]|uniref:helix-turn-helix domain-containing protein n=1 Tax=Cytobacillus horneckiae TaxID=549687 RepID=UPI0039A0EA0E
MKLISKIRPLIDESGYKRKFIADKLKISVKQLRNYETGHSLIPIDKAYILAKIIGKDINDLYEIGEEDEGTN